ncbi:MAG TPA: hypothetical protein VJU80_07965, partial [Solirubrobacteraceae bacterium]|nr:hypothetical protein [Solirubrobacteraceae bacterium]
MVMAAVPAVASAQVVLNGALLNPSVSAPPGSVVGSTRLVVTIPTGGTTPTYISYSLGGTPGSSPCLLLSRASGFDSSGHIAYGTTVNRDLGPLPRAPGNVHVNIRAWTSSSCTGASGSNVETVLDVVTAPVTNPRLPARCGLRVILVLDESGSIVAPPGRPDLGNQTATVQKAARGFVEALTGTGSRLAIIAFSRRSRDGVSYRTVTRGAADVFKSWIGENGHAGASVDGNAGYHPQNRTENNGTNWQSPLERVQEMNETDGKADLVMFVTDGDPNFHNGIAVTGSALTDGAAAAMIPAWKAANTVKGNGAGTGSKVFAIG